MDRRQAMRWLAGIVLLAFCIRAHHVTDRSFWFDEAFSWRLITYDFDDVYERTKHDNHPPLYFLVLKLWSMAAGTSPLALRGLSILFGGVTVVAIYLFVVEAYRHSPADVPGDCTDPYAHCRPLGLLAAALIALSVFQIRWGPEARMYTLGTTLAALSSWMLFRAIHQRAQSIRIWLIYAAIALLFAYTHYYALFSIVAQFMFLIGHVVYTHLCGRRTVGYHRLARHIVVAALIIGAGWVPWFPYFRAQLAQVQSDIWIRPLRASDVLALSYQMLFEPQDARPSLMWAIIVTIVCAAVLGQLLVQPGPGDLFVFTNALVPLIISVGVSLCCARVFLPRYLLFAHLFLIASFARALWRFPPGLVRRLMVGSVLFIAASIDAWFILTLDIPNKPGVKAAVEYLSAVRRDSEPVVVCSHSLYLPCLYHSPSSRSWYLYVDSGGLRHYQGKAVIQADELIRFPDVCNLKSPRVWVVNMLRGNSSPRVVPIPPGWRKRRTATFEEVYRFQGTVSVEEYVTTSAELRSES